MVFTHDGWKMLIDLALQHGWQPAGVQEPDPTEDGALDEGDFVELSQGQLQACELPGDHPLAQDVKSLLFPFGDPVLDAYFHNAGLRASAEDARALADSLERALPDVPSHDALADKVVTVGGERCLPLGTAVSPFEWFSGANRRHLEEFIALCRQGGFAIW
jgi:hypothetical protein